MVVRPEGPVVSEDQVPRRVDGGVLVSVSEMVLGSEPFRVGCSLMLTAYSGSDGETLFSEFGGIVIEVVGSLWDDTRRRLEKDRIPFVELGHTVDEHLLEISLAEGSVQIPYEELVAAHRGHLPDLLR